MRTQPTQSTQPTPSARPVAVEPAESAEPSRSPLRSPGFARLWISAFFSETAEWMLQVALPLLVYQLTGSATSTAASIVLGLLPAVALSPVAGVLADRCDRRVLLCLVCLGQAVVALPLLVVPGGGAAWPVYLVMAAQAGLASLFEPARNALVPQLVGPEQVTGANGLMSVNSSVARLAGGWLGGLLLGLGDVTWVLGGYLLALLLAVVPLLRPLGVAVPRPGTIAGGPARASVLREWLDGLGEFAADRRLRLAAAVIALTSLAQGMFLVLFVLFAVNSLGASTAQVGLLRGVQAIGGLAAGFAVATVARSVPPARLLGWGALATGVLSAVIWNGPWLTTALGVYLGLLAAVGAPGVILGSGLLSVLQSSASPERAGRVLSTAFAGMAGCTALGALGAGVLAGTAGLPALLNAQAALHLVAGLLVLRTLARAGAARSRGTVSVTQAPG